MSSKSDAELRAEVKDDSRSGRLSFRNFAEHQLRSEFKSIAIEKCKDKLQAFGKCSEDNGLLVVFRCRGVLKEMNACMATYNSNEEFEKYLAKHRPDLLTKQKK